MSNNHIKSYQNITDIIALSYVLMIDIDVDYNEKVDTHFVYITNKIDTYVQEITDIHDDESWNKVIELMMLMQKNYSIKTRKLESSKMLQIIDTTDYFVVSLENKTKNILIKN